MARKKLSKFDKRRETLSAKTKIQKEALLEQLAKYPIIETACGRAGVGRSTYYDWARDDKTFAKRAAEALAKGEAFVNDMAESMLIKNIQNGSNTSIIFWLKNHHHSYSDKIRHEHEIVERDLTEEERLTLTKALFNVGVRSVIKTGNKITLEVEAADEGRWVMKKEKSLPEEVRSKEKESTESEAEREMQEAPEPGRKMSHSEKIYRQKYIEPYIGKE